MEEVYRGIVRCRSPDDRSWDPVQTFLPDRDLSGRRDVQIVQIGATDRLKSRSTAPGTLQGRLQVGTPSSLREM
jgi:hypothetical protein